MKLLLSFFILLPSLVAAAQEFNIGPRYSVGVGFVEEKGTPNADYRSEVLGIVYLFNNEKEIDKMSVNLLGLGLSRNSKNENFIVLSPLSMVYNRHLSISYNLHLKKINDDGFSLNYQF